MAKKEINYKPLFLDKIVEFNEILPEYSIGEILYSILTEIGREGYNTKQKLDLLDIPDNVFYSAVDKAIKKETE